MEHMYKKIGIAIITILSINTPYTQPKTPLIKTINIRNTSKNFKNMTCTKTVVNASNSLGINTKLIAGITAITTIALLSIGALIWYTKYHTQNTAQYELKSPIDSDPITRENILKYACIHRSKGRAIVKDGCIIRG